MGIEPKQNCIEGLIQNILLNKIEFFLLYRYAFMLCTYICTYIA